MVRVLIAEDEPSFRELLENALQEHGYETRSAGSGRQAIELGIRFHPDVLIADWMLSNRYHGLHVAETVRLMWPQLQTILVTGFASEDVGYDATQVGVFDLIHKPLDFGRLLQSLDNAVRASLPAIEPPPFAVLQVDPALRIVGRNMRLGPPWLEGAPDPPTLDALLSPGRIPDLESSRHEWQESRLRSGQRVLVRARAWDQLPGYLLLLLPQMPVAAVRPPHFGKDFLIRALLDLGPPGRMDSVAGRALVVEGSTGSRRRLVRRIEHAGFLCHSADELRLAKRLLEHDPGIRVVVLEGDLLWREHPVEGLSAWLETVRDHHPRAVLLAHATVNRSRELKELGVDRFVRRARLLEAVLEELKDQRAA